MNANKNKHEKLRNKLAGQLEAHAGIEVVEAEAGEATEVEEEVK